MLSERPYMNSLPPVAQVLKFLLIANLCCFFVQSVSLHWLNSAVLLQTFSLTGSNVVKGYVWTLITYAFLHANIFHLLLNLIVLYFVGSIIEQLEGPKRFLYIYIASTIIGGLLWLFFHGTKAHQLIGASAATLGLLIYYCLHQPDRPITLLLFLVLPVTLKPRWIMWGIFLLDLFGFLFQEMGNPAGAYANSAHLGGMLGGFICYRIFHNQQTNEGVDHILSMLSSRWLNRNPSKKIGRASFRLNMGSFHSDLSAEVDRILDKINEKGFGSLSDEEKKILDKARDNLKK